MRLFQGPLECEGMDIDEATVESSVSQNTDFWKAMRDAVRSGRIPKQQTGVWSFRLTLQFFCQDGSPVVVDPASETNSFQTDQEWQFTEQRVRPLGQSRMLLRMITKQNAILAQVVSGLPAMMQQSVAAGCELLKASAESSHRLLAAGSEPLKQALSDLADARKQESERFESAVKAVNRLQQVVSKPGDTPLQSAERLVNIGMNAFNLVSKLAN